MAAPRCSVSVSVAKLSVNISDWKSENSPKPNKESKTLSNSLGKIKKYDSIILTQVLGEYRDVAQDAIKIKVSI